MKTLKRTLCIALVLAMAVGLFAISAGAKSLSDYKDADTVSDEYTVAVDFDTQLGVLRGVADDTFGPKTTLTRAQLATMIYRIVTGDVNDKYVANYANAQRFTDVAPGAWYAGYVNYCADNGYLKGVGDNKYNPDATLTGYQAMAALLRAIGYDKNGEFEGKDWTVAVTKLASKIDGGIKADWSQPISREVTAQLVMNTLRANPAVYIAALGQYVALGDVIPAPYVGAIKFAAPLANSVFGVEDEAIGTDVDGNPSYLYLNRKGAAVITIPLTPVKTYTTKVPVCDLLVDAGVPKTSTAKVNVALLQNGVLFENYDWTHKDLACEDEDDLHGQGVVTKVYDMGDFDCDADYIVAQVFYYLAQVTKVDKTAHGKAGETTLNVWAAGAGEDPIEVKVPGASYAKGTWLIVHDIGEGYKFYVEEEIDQIRPFIKRAVKAVTDKPEPAREAGETFVIDYEAKTMTGKLEKVIENQKAKTITFQINGKKENLNIDYYMSDAMKEAEDEGFKGKNFTWFLDKYGNIIGDIEKVAPDSYAVIDRIAYREKGLDDGYAEANIVDMDAKMTKNYKVTKVDGEAIVNGEGSAVEYPSKPAQGWELNEDWEAPLYVVSGSEFTPVELSAEDVSITKGISKIETDDGNIYSNKNTVFLYRTGTRGAYKYDSYKGVTKAPSVESANIWYVLDADEHYITVIFVDVASVGGGSTGTYIIPNDFTYDEVRYTDSNEDEIEAYVYTVYDLEGKPVEILSKEEITPDAGIYDIKFDADGFVVDGAPSDKYNDSEVASEDYYDGEVFIGDDELGHDVVDAKIIVIDTDVTVYAAGDDEVIDLLNGTENGGNGDGNVVLTLAAEQNAQAYSVMYIIVAAE